MNVSNYELQQFENIKSQWWDINGPMKTLHALNETRIPFIIDGLVRTGQIKAEKIGSSDVLKGIKILDVGCGAGVLSEALGKLGATVTGLEPGKGLVEIAENHLEGQSLDVEYVCELIEEFSAKNSEKYDAVVASEVIEHVPDQRAFLHECVKCVKPKGSMVVTTINKTYASLIGAKIFGEYVLGIVPIGTHDWNNFISPRNVSDILSNLKCNTTRVQGTGYNIFTGAFYDSWFEWISYSLHAVKHSSLK